MKLIKPHFEVWEQPAGLEGVYKQIERAGRVCYKSEDKITENSAKEFVDRIIKSGHGAMLEHGSIYLYIETDTEPSLMVKEIINFYKYNKYSHVNTEYILDKDQDSHTPLIIGYKYYISTNLRVCIENDRKEFLNPSLLCEPTEFHEKRITVKFICDRGILAEFTRHRTFSFSAESTRYCNYSKDKFNNEITYILPCWIDNTSLQEIKGSIISQDKYGSLISEYYYHLTGKEWTWKITPERNFIASLQVAEQLYLELLNQGWKPQEARAVLPNALKTELVMTGFISDWKHFFELRDAGSAHPQAQELAKPLHEEFIKRGYITE